jgi:putative FmdB family regulatory protein
MPIYEYRCDQCGHQFEVIQKFSDDPLDMCEHCRGHLSKLISQTSFQLKGSGWYMTDYARKAASNTSATETNPETKPADAPKAETSKTETAKADTSKSEISKTDVHKADRHKNDKRKTETAASSTK